MPETTFNNIRVPSQADMWDLVGDLKKMAESINAPFVVGSKAQRDALTGPGVGPVPDGTVVIRRDQGGVIDIRAGGAWVDGDTGWVNIPLASGYVAQGSPSPAVRRINGVIYIVGLVRPSSGTLPAGAQTIGTLPAEFRPSAFLYRTTDSSTTNINTRCLIKNTGEIEVNPNASGAAWVSLAVAPWPRN